MFQLSYSSLSVWKDCPRCFYYDRKLKRPRPQGIKSGMPNKVDEILKAGLEAYRGSLPPTLAALPELKGFQLYAGADLKKMRHWASNPFYMQDSAGNKVIGALDDLLHNPKKDIFAYLDYKTTGKEPDQEFGERYYQDQCDIYTRFFECRGKKVADFGVLLFFWPAPNDAGDGVMFKSKALILHPNPARAEERFAEAVELLNGDDIPDAGPTCEFCSFVEARR